MINNLCATFNKQNDTKEFNFWHLSLNIIDKIQKSVKKFDGVKPLQSTPAINSMREREKEIDSDRERERDIYMYVNLHLPPQFSVEIWHGSTLNKYMGNLTCLGIGGKDDFCINHNIFSISNKTCKECFFFAPSKKTFLLNII